MRSREGIMSSFTQSEQETSSLCRNVYKLKRSKDFGQRSWALCHLARCRSACWPLRHRGDNDVYRPHTNIYTNCSNFGSGEQKCSSTVYLLLVMKEGSELTYRTRVMLGIACLEFMPFKYILQPWVSPRQHLLLISNTKTRNSPRMTHTHLRGLFLEAK